MYVQWAGTGVFFLQALRQYHLSRLAMGGFQVTVALSITAQLSLSRYQDLYFRHLRTVPNRFLSPDWALYVELVP